MYIYVISMKRTSQIETCRNGREQRGNIKKEKRAVFLDFLAMLWIRINSFFGVSATDANTFSGHSSGFESKTGSDLKLLNSSYVPTFITCHFFSWFKLKIGSCRSGADKIRIRFRIRNDSEGRIIPISILIHF